MKDALTPQQPNPLLAADPAKTAELAAERRARISEFVRTNPEYYAAEFEKIGARSAFSPSFNLFAGLFGPIWFGARGLWNWALAFLIIETFALVQITRGFFGDLAATARDRIASIEGTLELRKQQLAAAVESGSDKVDVYKRAVDSLEGAIGGIRLEAQQLEEQGIWIALSGLLVLALVKAAQAMCANAILESRFSDWLSDPKIRSGMPRADMALSALFFAIITGAATLHYTLPGQFGLLSDFPTDPDIRLTSIAGVEAFFSFAVRNGEALFDLITFGIRSILDALELIFVQTPWMVIASFIILLTYLSAGVRPAIYSGAFLAYIGLLGFWVKAMTTLALWGRRRACRS